MKFDYYHPFYSVQKKCWCPGVKAQPMEQTYFETLLDMPEVKKTIEEFQQGDKEAKKKLPAICWMGTSASGKRLASDMQPTQFIMIDIDHVEDAKQKALFLISAHEKDFGEYKIRLVHITPSGKGIRIVFRATQDFKTVKEHQEWLVEKLNLNEFGDIDDAVTDLSRLSFVVHRDYLVYYDKALFEEECDFAPIANTDVQTQIKKKSQSEEKSLFPLISDEDRSNLEKFEYKGTFITEIAKRYVETFGTPESGEIHNYYNRMVKNFRGICDNNKKVLLVCLPSFGHSEEERWSQINSICRTNTLSSLPKDFYFFLKDNGYYKPRPTEYAKEEEKFLLEGGEPKEEEKLPVFPPVFREIIKGAPRDFVVPIVNALMPILGTLTSYLRTTYPLDGRTHSTSFFSIIYAPPSTGKGFVERYMDMLFEDIKLRDYISSERENLYMRILQQKGSNDKAPDLPHTSLRIIPPKNSEPEFLQKQRDNHGYHMFTYAAEMDSWAKGVRAAGGNKDDMIRIAWDNGEYGQSFKSFNTFKGTVRLYWNVLITGTIAQLDKYFQNVENGLVTRCCFTSIDNQEFSEAPVWKALTKKDKAVIRKFLDRCDANTYYEPLNFDTSILYDISDEDFDKEVPWKYRFRDFKQVDISYIMPTIRAFLKEELETAALNIDRARDVFRKRVAVRGFRLALLCEALWEKPRQKEHEIVKHFVAWWMRKDLEGIMKLFGAKYNELQNTTDIHISQRTVYDELEEKFTRNDLYVVCRKQGIKTPVRRILFDWRKLKVVEKLTPDEYRKIIKNKKK